MIFHNGIVIDRKAQTITHNYNVRRFTDKYTNGAAMMFRAWEAMILGDMNADELFDHLYGHDPEGGPEGGRWIFYVRFHQWTPEFRRMQLRLVKDKRAGRVHYKLVPDVV